MSIKVKSLIEELQKLDPELYVVMSSDAEGNSYQFLEEININSKFHEGEIFLAELTQELKDKDYTEEDVSEEGVDCVVFYPTHESAILVSLLTKNTELNEN